MIKKLLQAHMHVPLSSYDVWVYPPSPRSVGLFGEGLGLLTLGGLSEEPDSILKQNSSNYIYVTHR